MTGKVLAFLGQTPPLAATFGTMAVSTVAWAALLDWPRAVCLTVIFLVHELGHVAAASAIRLRVRHLLFVPFLGALVLLRDEPRIVEQDAACALGGPAAGALFAMVCAFAALLTGNRLVGWTAAVGALVNLLNLVPLSPLDGGRVLAVLSPRLSFIGVPVWGFLLYRHWTPDMLLVAVVALWPLFGALRGDQADRETIAFYAAPGRVQASALAAYLTTVAVLALAFLMTRRP
jgi:membrane-associated protease RseP (regulator of RpoE activity)